MHIIDLKLTNFKRFVDETISFDRPLTVLVGKNNSGKTTLIEAMALLFGISPPMPIVRSKTKKLYANIGLQLRMQLNKDEWGRIVNTYPHLVMGKHFYPEYLNEFVSTLVGAVVVLTFQRSVGLDETQISSETRYAEIENKQVALGNFHDNEQSTVFQIFEKILSEKNIGIILGVVLFSAERTLHSSEKFQPLNWLSEQQKRHEFIRNNLYHLKRREPDKYEYLLQVVSSVFDNNITDVQHNEDTGLIDLELAEGQEGQEKVEMHEMGSGLKSFLRILVRIISSDTTVALLDEPDISMHPGLVNQLADLLEDLSMKVQIIISTHHETFVNRVDSSSILHVRASGELLSTVTPLTEDDTVTSILDDLGISRENFAKYETEHSGVIVLGEGKTDWKYIQKFAKRLKMWDKLSSVKAKYFPLQGSKIIHPEILDRMHGSPIPFLLFRDRDENTDIQIERIQQKLRVERSHFLSRREIENYALDYKALLTLLQERSLGKPDDIRSRIQSLTEESLKEQVKLLAEHLKTKVILLRFVVRLPESPLLKFRDVHDFVERNKNRDTSEILNDVASQIVDRVVNFSRDKLEQILTEQRTYVEREWTDTEILNICPGKELLKSINIWTAKEFGINVSVLELIDRIEVIDDDIVDLINKIINLPRLASVTSSP
jgi:predicted ATP-dependent endonuclease of OLD family